MNDQDFESRIRKHLLDDASCVEAAPELDERIQKNMAEAYDRARSEIAARGTGTPGRRWSRRLVRWAPAAAVLLTALILLDPWGGAGVAWGEVAARVSAIETFFFRLEISVDADTLQEHEVQSEWVVYLSSEYGLRWDTLVNGEVVYQVFVPADGGTQIQVMPTGKMWTSFAMSGEQHPFNIEDEKDVRHHIRMFMEQPYTHLGHSRIDGIEVAGIETGNLSYKGETWTDGTARLWADVRTGLPVRMEFTGIAENQRFRFLYDIRWEEEFDKSVFTPDIEGYSPIVYEFGELDDPNSGIDASGLSADAAVSEVLRQFFQALVEEDLGRIRKLLPAFKVWSSGHIRDACNMDSEAAVTAILEIGDPELFHETEKGRYYLSRVTFVGRDRRTRVQDMLVLYRESEGGKASGLVYGALSGHRVIE